MQDNPGCPYPLCAEPNPELHAIVSAISAGPIADGGRIGNLNKTLLFQTCQADGTLLKPDKPATVLDKAYIPYNCPSNSPPLVHLMDAYSQHLVMDNNLPENLQWHYLLAANLPIPFMLIPSDLGLDDSQIYVVVDFYNHSTIAMFNTDLPLVLSATPEFKTRDAKIPFHYYIIAPLSQMQRGCQGWTILGELNKFVTASSQRFSNWHIKGDFSTTVDISGSPYEMVTVSGLFSGIGMTIQDTTCSLNAQGKATIVCTDKCQCNTQAPNQSM